MYLAIIKRLYSKKMSEGWVLFRVVIAHRTICIAENVPLVIISNLFHLKPSTFQWVISKVDLTDTKLYVIKRDNTKSGLTAVTFIGAGQAVMSVAAIILAITAPGERDALPRVTAELVGRAVWHYSWQRENLLVSSASINFMTKPEQNNKRHTATLSGLKKDWLGYKKSLQKCLIRSVYYLAMHRYRSRIAVYPPTPTTIGPVSCFQ